MIEESIITESEANDKIVLEGTDASPGPIPIQAEILRKLVHLLALVIPAGLMLVDRSVGIGVLSLFAAGAIAAEIARVRSEGFARIINKIFGGMMRPHEVPRVGDPVVINGATWVLIASALTALIFPKHIAAASLAIFMIGDAAAAIVGRLIGTVKLNKAGKTLEGLIAFVLATLPLSYFIPGPEALIGGIGCFLGAILESLPGPFNDNLRVPILVGFAMLLASAYLA